MQRPKMFAVLPTLLTLGNAACGFGAITYAAKIGPEAAETSEIDLISPLDAAGRKAQVERSTHPDSRRSIPVSDRSHDGEFQPDDVKHLTRAVLLIFLAMLFDMLDGSAARWARQTSDFGAELDSLCDAISFGVAPAFLMLQFSRHESVLAPGFITRMFWVIAALYVVCAVLRLARFNVESDDEDLHEYFSGLPSPAAAGAIASYPIAMRELKALADSDAGGFARSLADWVFPVVRYSLPLVTFAVACLMVSRIRYPHVFNQLFRGQRSRQQVIQLVFAVAVIFLVRESAIPLIFCYFAFAAPVTSLWRHVVGRRRLTMTKV